MQIGFESTHYLDCHLSGVILVIGVRIKCRSERELGAVNVLPVIIVTIESDNPRYEIGYDLDLRVRFTTPFAGFLVRHDGLRRENQEPRYNHELKHFDFSSGVWFPQLTGDYYLTLQTVSKSRQL